MQSSGQSDDARSERRQERALANQVNRAAAAVELSVDGLPPRYRVAVLNEALRNALDDCRWQEAEHLLLELLRVPPVGQPGHSVQFTHRG